MTRVEHISVQGVEAEAICGLFRNDILKRTLRTAQTHRGKQLASKEHVEPTKLALPAQVKAYFQKHGDQDRRQKSHHEEGNDENGAEIDEGIGSHDENGEEIEEDHGSTSILSKVS